MTFLLHVNDDGVTRGRTRENIFVGENSFVHQTEKGVPHVSIRRYHIIPHADRRWNHYRFASPVRYETDPSIRTGFLFLAFIISILKTKGFSHGTTTHSIIDDVTRAHLLLPSLRMDPGERRAAERTVFPLQERSVFQWGSPSL